jgi:protein FAM32A
MNTNIIPGKLKLKNAKHDKVFNQMKKIITKDIKTIKPTKSFLNLEEDQNYNNDNDISSQSKEEKIEKTQKTKEEDDLEKYGFLDTRTQAEKLFDERRLKRLPEMVKRNANVTFKQKLEVYNKSLSKLPEHYDIPKVGPG